MRDLVALVPTLERPHNVARLAKAFSDTITGRTDVQFIFDDDDPTLEDGLKAAAPWLTRVQNRLITIAKLNRAALASVDDYPVLMFIADDCVPRTRGWDEMIVGAIGDLGGCGMAYPNGLGRTDIPELVAISSDIVRALGWFGLPSIHHYWIDSVWGDLGQNAGCLTYLPDCVIEHLHHTFGKAPRDHIYALGERYFQQDRASLEIWRATRLPADVAKIRRLRRG